MNRQPSDKFPVSKMVEDALSAGALMTPVANLGPDQLPDPARMCGRCYDEADLFPANCDEKPEALLGQPIGMYHCPDCGAMVMAGIPHPPLCKPCIERKHPAFDEAQQEDIVETLTREQIEALAQQYSPPNTQADWRIPIVCALALRALRDG